MGPHPEYSLHDHIHTHKLQLQTWNPFKRQSNPQLTTSQRPSRELAQQLPRRPTRSRPRTLRLALAHVSKLLATPSATRLTNRVTTPRPRPTSNLCKWRSSMDVFLVI